jgi:hypothetical protein
MNSATQSHFLDGGAEEWLRRIAVGPAPANVPDPVAFALVAMGFAAKTAEGKFEVTPEGRAHLDAQGIAHGTPRDRPGRRRSVR